MIFFRIFQDFSGFFKIFQDLEIYLPSSLAILGLYQKRDVSLTLVTWTTLTSCGSATLSDDRRDAVDGAGDPSLLQIHQKKEKSMKIHLLTMNETMNEKIADL